MASEIQGGWAKNAADLRAALDAHAIVAITDPRGLFTHVNDAFCEISQYSRAELLGRDHRLLNSGHHPKAYMRELWRTVCAGRVWKGELRNRAKDGSHFWVAATIVPFCNNEDEEAAPGEFLALLHDITERKRLEAHAEELRAEMAHSSRVATLGELVAALAHELNQPLAAILSNAQAARRFLAEGIVDPQELRATLDDIIRDDKRAGAVIQHLRAMLTKRPALRETCCLNDIVREVLELLHGELLGAHVAVRTTLASLLPGVEAARVELQQVLVNFILNAVQAMQELPRERRRLEIETATGSGHVSVAVRDQGGGIPPDRLPDIFVPFYTTKAGGLGMGLCICLRIVENHGGRIEVSEHAAGGGGLPRLAAGGTKTGPWSDRQSGAGAPAFGNRKMPRPPIQLYIVDDEPSLRTAYGRLARSAKMEPQAFASVEEFLQTELSDENACVICDVRMPARSGLELPEWLARAGRQLPVIFITAHDTPETRAIAHRAGAAGYFSKPVDDQALLDAIAWALSAHAPPSERDP